MDEEYFKSKFDWKIYVNKYEDLQKAGIDTEKKAWNHAKKHGQKEKEKRDVFNGDKELLRLFRNFCISGNVKPIPDKYKTSCNNQKINIYFIIPNKNSIEYNISLNIGHNIEENVNYILNNEIKNFTINESDLIIFMSSSHLIDMTIRCNKIAWLYKWDENWIKSLNNFDYVLTGTNKMKLFIESKYKVKCYNFSIGCNLFKTINKNIPHYDVLFDVHEYNKYTDHIIKFIRNNNDMKIKIIGNEWLRLVTNNTDKDFLSNYYSDICINNDLDEIYNNSKIIVDFSDEKYLKYGCASDKITRAISNKKVIITNNNESSKEIFENKLVTFSSYEEMITHIKNYLTDNNKYTTNVNNLLDYSIQLLDNSKIINSLMRIRLFQKNNIKNDIIIKICGRGQPNFTFTDCVMWGDLYMANNISKQLESRYGITCQICLMNDWYNYDMYNCNNILFLRGISKYNPLPKNNNMVLFISHPETYTDKEFIQYNKIICCSKIFYEKIKNNLKLSDDDIIYALQPIDIPKNNEIETELLYDAVFIGNKMRERESVKWLTNDNFNKVKIFGDMWENKNINPIIQNIKSIDNCDVFDIYCKSKIILNDTWKDMCDNGFINNRVLEALTSGNFILTDNVKGIKEFNFINLFTYNNNHDLNKHFDFCIKRDADNKETNLNILKLNNSKLINFIYLNTCYNYSEWMESNVEKFNRSGIITDYKIKNYIKSSNIIIEKETDKPFIDISKIPKYNPTKKVGFIITTYGNCGIFVDKLVESINHFIGDNKFIVIYINEKADAQTFNLNKKYDNIELIFIENQHENHGLTGTWNQGIDLCFKNECEIIVLANNDIFITSDISYIIDEAIDCPDNKLYYYGPVTNNPGTHNYSQYSLSPRDKSTDICYQDNKIWNLNGFFLVFPKHVLNKNKIDNLYFDNKYPFGGNETEWFHRFLKIGGLPKIVYKTFVYHYKLQKWRQNNTINNDTCIFTIITGGYENSLHNHNHNNSNKDFFCFTDNLNLVFDCIKHNIYPILVFDQDKRLTQRTIKTSCHNYLPTNYNKSIYIDGNVIYFDNVINNLDLNEYEMICCVHPNKKKTKVIQEIEDIKANKLGRTENLNEISNIMKTNNFKDNVGLTETSFLIRKHTTNIIKMNEEWTKMINICHRDQVSFDYLKWKYNIFYKAIDSDYRPIFKVNHSDITNRVV